MANYDKTKFFWLQLKEDFFEEDTIQWLESQPNGKNYVYFYLKLCLKSLKSNGLLIQQVGKAYIPYKPEELARYTNTDVDTVKVAIDLFCKIGLIKMFDNGALYLEQVENLIGSQSKSAFKKQQQRIASVQDVQAKISGGGHLSPFCPPNIELELELDKDVCKGENTSNEKEIVCQRGKKFKDSTCKTCWHYAECKRKKIEPNTPQWLIDKLTNEESKEKEVQQIDCSIEDLEKFFKSDSNSQKN